MAKKPLKKLLFVDDDEDILQIIRYSITDLYESDVIIKYVNSGEEAIKEALQFQPNLILLDVMMPKMDGIATFKTIRLLPTIANTPIIFITAKAQKEEVDSYFELGASDVIIKPFDPLMLPDLIQKVWDAT